MSSTQQLSQYANNDVPTGSKRRTSSRVPEGKRPYYGPAPTPKPLPPKTTKNKSNNKKKKISTNNTSNNVSSRAASDDATIEVKLEQPVTESVTAISTRYPYPSHSADDIQKVRDVLELYNKRYLHFLQDKVAFAKKCEDKKLKNGGSNKKQVKRADLDAASEMRDRNQVLYPEKRIGHLPGIEVGRKFSSRNEMVAVGLHSEWLKGIDCIGDDYQEKEGYKGYKLPLAVSIILSGQYEDDNDDLEEIAYTGQGGNDLNATKKQVKDQKLASGNLALKNSMEQSIPVRFIRGYKGKAKKTGFKTYSYDGLYKVESWWLEEGKSGFKVYKFGLKRLEGQPELQSNKVEYKHGQSSKVGVEPINPDISGGQEKLPIPVFNTVDDATITGFTYTKSLEVPSSLKLPPNADGCNCRGKCTNPKICACAKLNGGAFPYQVHGGGRLYEAKDVIFECGPKCGCGPGCGNRRSQRNIDYRLEVFRTSDRGWAVRTKDLIPSGAPICEYIGKLQRTNEMDKVVDNNEYIFEIDCQQTIKEIGRRERRLGAVAVDEKESTPVDPEFCIDGGSIGNVARFINHSCDPNMFVQCVVSSHHDLKLARIVLVASENIHPRQELTYDYGYELGSVIDESRDVKTLTCRCGTKACRGRLY